MVSEFYEGKTELSHMSHQPSSNHFSPNLYITEIICLPKIIWNVLATHDFHVSQVPRLPSPPSPPPHYLLVKVLMLINSRILITRKGYLILKQKDVAEEWLLCTYN